MRFIGLIYSVPISLFPALGSTPNTTIRVSISDTVSGKIRIRSSDRIQVIADLRKLADELEKIDHSKVKP